VNLHKPLFGNLSPFGFAVSALVVIMSVIAMTVLIRTIKANSNKGMHFLSGLYVLLYLMMAFWSYAFNESDWVKFDMGAPDWELWMQIFTATGWSILVVVIMIILSSIVVVKKKLLPLKIVVVSCGCSSVIAISTSFFSLILTK